MSHARIRLLCVLAVAGALTSGCAQSRDASTPMTSAPSSAAGTRTDHPNARLPDACAIPDAVLRGYGLRPDTANPLDATGWRTCSWSAADDRPFETAEVAAATVAYPELLANSQFDRFTPTSVGNRDATFYRKAGDTKYDCAIAWATSVGIVIATITARTGGRTTWSDPCDHVQGWADAIFPALPG